MALGTATSKVFVTVNFYMLLFQMCRIHAKLTNITIKCNKKGYNFTIIYTYNCYIYTVNNIKSDGISTMTFSATMLPNMLRKKLMCNKLKMLIFSRSWFSYTIFIKAFRFAREKIIFICIFWKQFSKLRIQLNKNSYEWHIQFINVLN